MADDDVRIAQWNLRATAGTTVSRPFTATTAVTTVAVYTGGTVADVDDLTDATEHPATVDAGGLGGTVTLDVPTGNSVPLRLVVDGAVVAVGRLTPSTTGTDTRDDTVTIATAEASTLTLELPAIVVTGGPGGSGTDDQTAAEVPFAPAGSVEATDVQAAIVELDADLVTEADLRAAADTALSDSLTAEQVVRADADAALDGRVDAIEGDYVQAAALAAKADLVGGVVPTAQIPAFAIMERVPVADEAARLALTSVQVGDVAVQADTGTTWLLVDADPSLPGSWKAIDQSDAVSSVNGQTGTVVLGKADVGLGDVDNTADLAKPVSAAQQVVLDAKETPAGAQAKADAALAAANTYTDTAVDNATSAVAPVPTNVPILPSGIAGDSTELVMPKDRLHFCGWIDLDINRTLSKMSVWVRTVGDGAAVVRFATAPLGAGTFVGETLVEHGMVDGTTAAVQTLSGIGTVLAAGRHGIFVVTNGETATAPTLRTTHIVPQGFSLGGNEAELVNARGANTHVASEYPGAISGAVPVFATGNTNRSPIIPVEFSA